MLELLFVIGFFVMLMVTGVSLLGYYRRADCGDGPLCSSAVCWH